MKTGRPTTRTESSRLVASGKYTRYADERSSCPTYSPGVERGPSLPLRSPGGTCTKARQPKTRTPDMSQGTPCMRK
eukprot:480952-Prorocentrum_minimum.AAC.1